MTEESLKNKTIKGVLWSSVERFSVQGVQFLVMLVIARILDPKDLGLVGMLAVFLAVAQSLIDSGFSQALIRKQSRTETDYNTVFFFNIGVSFLLYSLFYAISPWVAIFYEEPQLTSLMRVLCLVVIINSFAVVQRAIYTTAIDFKTQARASFFSAIISGCVGVFWAKNGYGVWTLVWQQLLSASLNTFLLWVYSNWHPKILFSFNSFRELFSFGSKLLVSGLIDTLYKNMYALVIGKIFDATSLGFYTQADKITKLPSSNITGVLQRVSYPVLCKLQENSEELRKDYRMLIKFSAFIIFPLMCGLAALASPLIEILLGEKWLFSAKLVVPLCFNMMFYPIAAINLNLLQVKGRSDLFLRLEVIKKIIAVFFLIVSVPFGLEFMCYSLIVYGLIALYLNAYYTRILIEVDFWMQLKDISIILVTSLSMFFLMIGLSQFLSNVWLRFFIELIFGAIFYSLVSCILCAPEIAALKNVFMVVFDKNRRK